MKDWKGTQFTDVGGGFYELTHKTKGTYTIKIIVPPAEGNKTVANPRMRLSKTEFMMGEKTFDEHVNNGNIKIRLWVGLK